ncbi:calcium-dependent protein kinase 1-like isoform X5 [Sebastes umbrosus]|uniref:calcium-dependent protein kinase 1-like isoform X5 n=1 Tax=Sebastes umbrosus TaxID=72105 RepID=UPI00189D9E49|nr:calcium-dependent protein kinase 1-like isoform X5 [Sebastes umbrosus]
MPSTLRTSSASTAERPSSSRNLVSKTVDHSYSKLDNRSGGNQKATKRKSDESHERAIKTSRTSQCPSEGFRPSFSRGTFYSAEDAGTSTPPCASISSKSEEKKDRKRRFEDTEAYGKRKRTFLSPSEGTSYQATTEAIPKTIPETTTEATTEATFSYRSDTFFSENSREMIYSTGDAGKSTTASTKSEEKKGRKRKSEETEASGERTRTFLRPVEGTSYQATTETTPEAISEAIPEAIPEATTETSFSYGSDTFFSEDSGETFCSVEDAVSRILASGILSTDSEEKKSRKRMSEDTGDYGKRRRTSLSPGEGCSYQVTTEAIPKTIPEHSPWASFSSESDTSFPEATLFHNRADFEAKYRKERMLGEGGYGAVFAGHRKDDHLPVAIKHIRRFHCTTVDLDGVITAIPTEVALLLHLKPAAAGTSAVVSLLDWYNLGNELILVLERPVPCMDLYDYLESIQLPIEEKIARIITKQLVEGLQEVQSRGVFHRDIKTENILIETGSDVPRVRIIDFGCGAFLTEERYTKNKGTPIYTTPEYIRRGWSTPEATTVWQLGVVLFEILHDGAPPFRTPRDISHSAPDIRDELSYNCQDFLARCLDKSPEARPTLETLKHHPWLVIRGMRVPV